MSSIDIKIEHEGDILHVVKDANTYAMYENPNEVLGKKLDGVISDIKKVLGIEPDALEAEKLGRAATLFFRYSHDGLTDEEIGLEILKVMANLPEPPKGRPIKDSPQA